MVRLLRLIPALALLTSTACASYSTRLSARPIPKGKTELGIAADVWVAETKSGRVVLPVAEMTLRYGLSDRVDVGGKINLLGGEFNAKVALVRNDDFSLAIVPGAGLQTAAVTGDDANVFLGVFSMPILAGIQAGESIELIFGGKFMTHVPAATVNSSSSSQGNGDVLLLPGGMFGMRIILGESFCMFPEFNAHAVYNTDLGRWRKPVFQGGLGFQFLL